MKITLIGGALMFVVGMVVGVTKPPLGEQPPAPRVNTWVHQPMTSGPSVYHACVNGDRVYALQSKAWRGSDGLWPDARIAVAPGACR